MKTKMTGPKADIIAVGPAQFQPISIRQTVAHTFANTRTATEM